MPKSRQDFWKEKFARNERRDTENLLLLKDRGWDVVTVWECQLKNPVKVKEDVLAFLGER